MISPEPPGTNPPKLSRDLIDAICRELGHQPSKIWVLYSKTHNSIAFDPATKKPAHWTNKKVAEHIAKETGDVAMPLNEALKLIIKHQYGK